MSGYASIFTDSDTNESPFTSHPSKPCTTCSLSNRLGNFSSFGFSRALHSGVHLANVSKESYSESVEPVSVPITTIPMITIPPPTRVPVSVPVVVSTGVSNVVEVEEHCQVSKATCSSSTDIQDKPLDGPFAKVMSMPSVQNPFDTLVKNPATLPNMRGTPPTSTPSPFSIDIEKLKTVLDKLRSLPIPQLLDVLETVLPSDMMMNAKSMMKSVLKSMLKTYTNDDIIKNIYLLPIENIKKLQELQVPEPMKVAVHARASDSTSPLKWTFSDPSLESGELFFVRTFSDIPKDNPSYTFIDRTIAIGNFQSDYKPFNVIVNLNYPPNGIAQHEINVSMDQKTNQLIIKVGIYDNPAEPMLDILKELVPYLQKVNSAHFHQARILFHCHAGISRSSTVAIAYYCKLANSALYPILTMVKARRPVVNPNQGFIDALETYIQGE